MNRELDNGDPRDQESKSEGPGQDPQRYPAERTVGETGAGWREIPGQSKDIARELQINQSAVDAAREIGRFRTVSTNDLKRHQYGGDDAGVTRDLRSLAAEGLIERRTIWAGQRQGKIEFVALTERGRLLLERSEPGSGQAFYDRFVKPAELLHDAAIYPMFKTEADQIEKDGGRVRRVVLDYELKKSAYSPLAKAKALPAAEYERRQEEIAREHGLKVVRGHIALPDLRIEYETANGQQAHVDLELATEHYRGSHLAAKTEAGFKMYAAGSQADHLSSVLEEREITAEIFSL